MYFVLLQRKVLPLRFSLPLDSASPAMTAAWRKMLWWRSLNNLGC